MTKAANAGEKPKRRTGRIAGLIAVGVAVVLIASAAWVAVRTLQAKAELEAALPLAASAQSSMLSGDSTTAGQSIAGLARHARAAADLTSDPIFAASQALPFAGPNLTAFRQIAVAVDEVAARGLTPLASLAGTLDAGSLRPVNGSIALQPMIDAAPALESAESALGFAAKRIAAIDTSATISQVSDAVSRLGEAVGKASSAVATVSRAARLVPAMLGATEERNYLLLFQNNAEVRASGGLPGALALLTTSGGRFSLTAQTTANVIPRFEQPVLPIDYATESLYGNTVARYMQNVTATPDFPTSATLAAEMWRRQFGLSVDGVIAVDPVLLGYLLVAVGPVTLSTGDVIDSSNAVDFLLSGVYAKYPNPDVQDLVFADAARAVFGALSSGSGEPKALLTAFARGAKERRVLIWNSRPTEQAILAGTDFAGTLPVTNSGANVVGVFLNDATGGKMDYYLQTRTTASAGSCGSDPRRAYRTVVELSSTAPLDAATALPEYVTAGVRFGVAPGTIRTRVLVYGPVDSVVVGATVDGAPVNAQVERHLGRSVIQFILDLAPGARSTLAVNMLGADASTAPLEVRVTPLVRPRAVEISSHACP